MNSLSFSTKIIDWYYQEKRDLPWRSSSNAYFIWLSEVILQQTRVDQGINYYRRMIQRFPNVDVLAAANEEEVLKLWQGLGYYSRARNLHKGAKQIVKDYGSEFPNSYNELKKIAGIGDYTASAIASIAFNKPVAAIDGNVFRVLSRIYNISTPIDTSQGKKEFKELANDLLDKNSPGDYNQAVMEFGAMQCIPKGADCVSCIFKDNCLAYSYGKIDLLPVKKNKTKVRNRFFTYIIIADGNDVYLKKRTENDVWHNLYDFPLIETDIANTIENIMVSEKWTELLAGVNYDVVDIGQELLHILSHQRLHIRFVTICINNGNKFGSNFLKIDKRNIFDLPVPKVIETYIGKNELF